MHKVRPSISLPINHKKSFILLSRLKNKNNNILDHKDVLTKTPLNKANPITNSPNNLSPIIKPSNKNPYQSTYNSIKIITFITSLEIHDRFWTYKVEIYSEELEKRCT